MDTSAFGSAAERYLRHALGPTELRVMGARRIVGGASRHTWTVDVDWGGPKQDERPDGLIFRLDPPASLLASNRATEYAMYRAMAGVDGVPVPRAILIEDDPGPLGMPFFVMERLDGAAWPAELLGPDYDGRREPIGRQMYRILGAIATADPAALGLLDHLVAPPPGEAWAVELERWERVLGAHDLGPMPVTRALIRELRRNPPPATADGRVVHGDFRIGNLLFVPDGIVGVLDWEMAHLGDPHEDLAWSMARNWRSGGAPDMVAAALAPAEAVAEWEAGSGLPVDTAALRWWALFSHVKAIAIWVTGAHEFASGRTSDLLFATLGWLSCGTQERWMLEDLGVVGP